MKILPKTFRFSLATTIITVFLAAVMFRASLWQWERYNYKIDLVKSFSDNLSSPPIPFTSEIATSEQLEKLINKKVHIKGKYDFSRQMIVLNRQHKSGSGYWLLTPLKIEGSNFHIIVSRGFIPFEDRSPNNWEKYNFNEYDDFNAVVQKSIGPKFKLAPSSAKKKSGEEDLIRQWFYPDIEEISKQLPFPILSSVYLQKLGTPPIGEFPAESISIDVPPSTHFGYTIEWAILGTLTLLIGFLIQSGLLRRKYLEIKNLSLILTLSLSVFIFKDFAYATSKPEEVEQKAAISEKLGSKINLNLRFINEHGESVRLGDLLINNRPSILVPVYFGCPRLCSLTQEGITEAINKLPLILGKDYSVISVSFAANENLSLAKEKADKIRSNLDQTKEDLNPSAWHFLVGNEATSKEIITSIGFNYAEDSSEYIHQAVFVVITPDGIISRYFYGIKYPERDVNFALVEASEGKIGSALVRIFLFCFRYDHLQGKYTIAVWNIVRVICIIGLAVFVIFLVKLRLGEKTPRY